MARLRPRPAAVLHPRPPSPEPPRRDGWMGGFEPEADSPAESAGPVYSGVLGLPTPFDMPTRYSAVLLEYEDSEKGNVHCHGSPVCKRFIPYYRSNKKGRRVGGWCLVCQWCIDNKFTEPQ
jgi:hypothetical protein